MMVFTRENDPSRPLRLPLPASPCCTGHADQHAPNAGRATQINHAPRAALATQITMLPVLDWPHRSTMLHVLHWPRRSACSKCCTGHTDQPCPTCCTGHANHSPRRAVLAPHISALDAVHFLRKSPCSTCTDAPLFTGGRRTTR